MKKLLINQGSDEWVEIEFYDFMVLEFSEPEEFGLKKVEDNGYVSVEATYERMNK